MKKGFTLTEILTSVVIVALLAAMAMPMYDKTIEKSRIAEARTILKKVFDSKMRMLDNLEKTTYSTSDFGFEQLDVDLACTNIDPTSTGKTAVCRTKSFRYSLIPGGTGPVSGVTVGNAVCAARCGGDYNNTAFLYYGSLTSGDTKLYCYGTGCDTYGLSSTGSSAWCSC